MSKTVLRKAAGVVLFLVLTAVLLVAAQFCWWTTYTPIPG